MDNIGNGAENAQPDDSPSVMGKPDETDADVMGGADLIDTDLWAAQISSTPMTLVVRISLTAMNLEAPTKTIRRFSALSIKSLNSSRFRSFELCTNECNLCEMRS